jgi:hypothetical protein
LIKLKNIKLSELNKCTKIEKEKIKAKIKMEEINRKTESQAIFNKKKVHSKFLSSTISK